MSSMKRLDDNTVRYCLYPLVTASSDHNEDQQAEQCEAYLIDCLAKLANHLIDYYWYYTPFKLNYISKASSHSKVSHIEGCTNFHENIEDEWFIVYLLFELSKDDPDLVIQVEDSDGDFLLIEAADALPKWVNPKTSVNRCYIYRGQLHLIPLDQPHSRSSSINSTSRHQSVKSEFPSKQPRPPTVEQALELIRSPAVHTVCSSAIQEQIKRKLCDYPATLRRRQHKCTVTLPSSIAFLLDQDARLISHSIRAFYNRDDLDLAACRLMRHFDAKQLVARPVHLSRFNYAQLLGQNYKPDCKLNWYSSTAHTPNRSSLTVHDDASTITPTSTAATASVGAAATQIERQYDLGFKISCGFEILVVEHKKKTHTPSNDERSSRRSSQQQRWKSFLSNLERRNYFANHTQQSADYDERLASARFCFENSELAQVTSDSASIEHSEIGERICDLLSEFESKQTSLYERYREEERCLPADDSDSWLSELPDYLCGGAQQDAQSGNSFEDLPSEITNCLQEFIKSDSDYKGVEPSDNPKKRKSDLKKSDLKERAFKMMSDNLRSIITMKVSDSESDTETDLSDNNYSSASSGEEAERNANELKYMKQQTRSNKSKKFKDRLNERKKRTKTESNANGQEMKQYMNEMDKELSATTIGQSFEKLSIVHRNAPMASCAEFDEDCSDDGELNDVDMKYNTVKNLLGSFKEQNGLAGPASNILSTLGVRRLPSDLD